MSNFLGIIDTINEWVGYYLHYNGYYYYIKSNTFTTLVLSDPLDTLESSMNKRYFIVKYFKIESNTSTVLTLTDNLSELINVGANLLKTLEIMGYSWALAVRTKGNLLASMQDQPS